MFIKYLLSLLTVSPTTVSPSEVASASEVVSPGDVSGFSFTFNPDNFVQSLPTMGICMLTIFIVMGLIIISTLILSKVGNGKKDEE